MADNDTIDPNNIPHLKEVLLTVYGIDLSTDPKELESLTPEELISAIQMANYWDVPFAASDTIAPDLIAKRISEINALHLKTTVTAKSYKRVIQHQVERGEDWESVATRFRIPVKELQEMNPFTVCATGVILNIPANLSDYALNENEKERINPDYRLACDYIIAEEYKRAIKLLDKVIESGDYPLGAIYHRGLAWYKRGKMRQAINDFSIVVSNDEDNLYSDASGYLESACEIQNSRDEACADLWNAIGLALVKSCAEVSAASGTAGWQYPAFGLSMPMGGIPYTGQSFNHGNDYLLPDFLRPETYASTIGTPQITYDKNGTPMVSFPGYAQMMRQMNQSTLNFALNSAANGRGDSYSTAMANANIGMALMNNSVGEISSTMMETPMYALPATNSSSTGGTGFSTSENSGNFDYQAQYTRYEHLASGHYSSLTTIGTRSTDDSGNIKGTTGNLGNPGGAAVTMKMNLREAQKQMARIRQEAAQHGITIIQSKWETATVSY